MVTVVVRALQSAFAVVAGIVTASQLGNTDTAKLAAVPIAFVASILIEYVLVNAPKGSRRMRKWLAESVR